jgi:hypothetical protein
LKNHKKSRGEAGLIAAIFFLWGACGLWGKEGESILIAPDNPDIQYSGRVDFSQPPLARFDWPLVTISALFMGPGIHILLKDGGNNYDIYVDGKLQQVLTTKSGVEDYPLQGFSPGEHYLRIIKRTEASWGIAFFKGFRLEKGSSLKLPSPLSSRRLEIVGDSISAGYGNEGPGIHCGNLRPSQNSDKTYGAFLAQDFRADCRIEAISGKGVVRNWGDKNKISPDPMPPFYPRTLAGDPTLKWDFTQWIPEAVILFLGSNDFSTEPHADREVFVSAYLQLLKTIRMNYPKTQIFCLERQDLPEMVEGVKEAVAFQRQEGDSRIQSVIIPPFSPRDMGCDGHPKVASHRALADYLAPFLAKTLGWKNFKAQPTDDIQ